MFTLVPKSRVLLVEAHPDDVVLGCGGTVAKFMGKMRFSSVTFAPCTEDPLNEGVLEENKKALNLLGVMDILHFSYPRNELFLHAQKIRNNLHKIKTEYHPNVIFCPSASDLHPDHSLVGQCCITIFRDSATILAYPILRSLGNFQPTCFVSLSQKHINLKLEALNIFKTQFRRQYFKDSIFLSELVYYGARINQEYAEAFEVLRWVM